MMKKVLTALLFLFSACNIALSADWVEVVSKKGYLDRASLMVNNEGNYEFWIKALNSNIFHIPDFQNKKAWFALTKCELDCKYRKLLVADMIIHGLNREVLARFDAGGYSIEIAPDSWLEGVYNVLCKQN